MGKALIGLFIMIMFCEHVLELSFGTTMFLVTLGMMGMLGTAGAAANNKSPQKQQKRQRRR